MSAFTEKALPGSVKKRMTFSLDHYEHLIACGAFTGEYVKGVELLWGEIVETAPIGPPHREDVDYLARWSLKVVDDALIRVSIQQPIRLPGSESEPEPDISWVREKSCAKRHPNPDEVLLVIEVAGSSLEIDRGPKLAAYAKAGIPEYWIVSCPRRWSRSAARRRGRTTRIVGS
ncbi:MAG: Uma2 family endonuclease [Planctomycetota bacterium]